MSSSFRRYAVGAGLVWGLLTLWARAQDVDSAGSIAPTPSANGLSPSNSINELIKSEKFTNHTGMVMIRVTPRLWASQHLVTQADYKAVSGMNPSRFPGANHPVDSVSWSDAMAFCERLTKAEAAKEMLPEGFIYTLPTEAQWQTLMADAHARDAVTSLQSRRAGTAPVGSMNPNKLGLYDTRGNVWQFTLGAQDKAFRVLRGGAWDTFVEMNLRPEFRWYASGPDDRRENYGFRCVLVPSK